MTLLLINGVEVILPKDFSVSVKRENSFFTRNGEYTYDCTLSLDNPVNATLYGFLSRVNKQEALALKRPAVLIADGHVYCRGTEVISSWTDRTVTIQIVSGNSELNYFIGQSLMVSYLNGNTGMGSITGDIQAPFVGTNASNDPKYTPPDSQGQGGLDYCMPTIYDPTTDTFYNQYVHRLKNDHTVNPIPELSVTDPSSLRACPYLCAVVRRLMKALGYTVGINHLEQQGSPFRYLFFVNTVDTKNYCDMFPGWSVGDLLQEIENLTNCHFVVDNETRTVDIINKTAYYLAAPNLTLNNVIDAYEAHVEDSFAEHSTSNLAYEIPDNQYARFESLSEKLSFKKETQSDFSAVCNRIQNEAFSLLTNTVVVDQTTARKFIKCATLSLADRGIELMEETGFFDEALPLRIMFQQYKAAWRTASPRLGAYYSDTEENVMEHWLLDERVPDLRPTFYELTGLADRTGISTNAPGVKEVDMLCPLKRADAKGEIKIAITPAHFAILPYWVEQYGERGMPTGGSYSGKWGTYMLASTIVAPSESSDGGESDAAQSETTFEDSIREGASANDASQVHLYVAFYNGYHQHRHGYLPTAYSDLWHAANLENFFWANRLDNYTQLFDNPFEHSLRLEWLDAQVFGGAYTIDTSHPFTFETFDPNILNPRAVIVVRNKRFVVRDIEEVIDAHGRKGSWKVTCYPFDISDGAVNLSWVLTTGLWDDHAVWLDTGKWLDGQ